MADNLAITPGVGALAKTDQGGVSGAHMQVVKLAVSADGDETLIPADATYGIDVDVTRLPATVASEATLAGIKTGTDKIPASPAQEHVAAASPHAARLTDGAGFYKATTPSDTQPISAASLPLPAGAAQEHVAAATPHAARLTDGSSFYKATTPTDTQPISAASLPLPSGAAQEHVTAVSPHAARLTTGAAFYDAPTAAQLPTALVSGRLDVNVGNTAAVSGTVTGNQGTAAVVGNAWPVKISDGSATAGISDVGGQKAVKVDVIQSVGAGSKVDKSAFTEGASTLDAIGGVYNETPAGDPTEDQIAVLRITAKRALHVNLRNASGTEIGTAGAPVRTDPTGSTTQPVSGTVTANQGSANTTPWNVNVKQVGGNDVVTAATGVQKVGVVDGAGTTFSDSNPLPVAPTSGGRTPVRKNVTYGASETAVEIWTPAGGKRFVIESIIISATGTGNLFIFDNTNVAGNLIFVGTPPAGGNPFQFVFPNGNQSAAINQILRYSTGVGAAGYITVHGYEV